MSRKQMLRGLGRQSCSCRMRFLVLWLPLPLVLLFLRAFGPQGKPTSDKPFTCIAGLLEKKNACIYCAVSSITV